MSDCQRNKDSQNKQPQDGGGKRSYPPSVKPSPSTCFLCLGEGRTERSVEYTYYQVTVDYETCQMCGGSGLISARDLYECQGHGCGILVTGATLVLMRGCGTPCRCKAPARRFAWADLADWQYPRTADEYEEAVWSLEDLTEGDRNGN